MIRALFNSLEIFGIAVYLESQVWFVYNRATTITLVVKKSTNLIGNNGVLMANFTPESVRKIQQDFSSGKRHTNITTEQRRIVNSFLSTLTPEQINAYYAKARQKGRE